MYGDSELLVGKWFQRTGQREKIFLADKFGIKADPANPLAFTFDSSAEYARAACEKCLSRLGTDYIDLCKSARKPHKHRHSVA